MGGGEWERGTPFSNRLKGFGERLELPQLGPERNPGQKKYFLPSKRHAQYTPVREMS